MVRAESSPWGFPRRLFPFVFTLFRFSFFFSVFLVFIFYSFFSVILGLGIGLRIPNGHGVELPHWSHDQPDFAHLADFGQVAVQCHAAAGTVVSLYDNTIE